MIAEFAKRLVAARKGTRFTQEEVAKVLGVDFTSISKYENGHVEPELTNLVKLADLYGVTIYWLLGGPENMEQKQLAIDTVQKQPIVTDEMLANIKLPSERHYIVLGNGNHVFDISITNDGFIKIKNWRG